MKLLFDKQTLIPKSKEHKRLSVGLNIVHDDPVSVLEEIISSVTDTEKEDVVIDLSTVR